MDSHRFTSKRARSSSQRLHTSRLAVWRALLPVSLVAIAGCSDRDEPTAVALRRPTLNVAGADYVVTTTADTGAGSLRQAIIDANAAGTAKLIAFDVPSSDAGCSAPNVCTITISKMLEPISNSAGLTIDGTGQSITLHGRDAARVLHVDQSGVATIKRLTITHGRADYTWYCGDLQGAAGGICNTGTLTVIESSLSHNDALGGGAIVNRGTLAIIGTTFSENSAPSSGAAIVDLGGSITITNATFSSNASSYGGAIAASGSDIRIANSTFAGNSGGTGASIYIEQSTVYLRNTILAVAPSQVNCFAWYDDPDAKYVDEGGNLSYGDASCPGLHADPKLGPLQLNAPGLTATHALLDGSPAIGLGVPANCPASDQRGVPRSQPARGRCDSGAYESALGPVDDTPPDVAPTITGTLGSNGWYTSNVTVSWSVTETGSVLASAPCAPTTISADTPGQAVSCSATSGGGTNTQTVTIKRDATAPTLAPAVSPNPVAVNGTATAAANASDQASGVASSSCGTPITNTLGNKTVNCTATDYAGNTTTVPVSYSVRFTFSGFLQPVDPMPTVNVVKAGAAVQIKFGLGGNQGMAVFGAGSPASQLVSCAAGAPQDDLEATVTAGNSSLSYDATTQLYSYTWKSDKSWANTCRTLSLTFVDGTTYQASFKFK